MWEDNGKKFTQDHNFRHTFSVDSPEVNATREFILSRIRLAIHGSLIQYDGTPQGYASATTAAQHQTVFTRNAPLWDLDVHASLDKHIAKAKTFLFNTSWAQQYAFIWPEMEPRFDAYVVPGFVPEDELVDSSDANSSVDGDVGSDTDNDDHDENGGGGNVSKVVSHGPPRSPPKHHLDRQENQNQKRSRSVPKLRTPQKQNRSRTISSDNSSSNDDGGAETENDSSDHAGGGSQNRSRSQSRSPEFDRTSWAAPNQANMNSNNIIRSSRKRRRKKPDYGNMVNYPEVVNSDDSDSN